MQCGIVRAVGSLVPQQIPVRTGTVIGEIALARLFADGQRDRAVRKARADTRHDRTDACIREERIFAALQNERAVAERVTFFTAGEYGIRIQAIPLHTGVAAADAAVVTVVFAIVRKLDQTAHKHGVSVNTSAHRICGGKQRVVESSGLQHSLQFRIGQISLRLQFLYKLGHTQQCAQLPQSGNCDGS